MKKYSIIIYGNDIEKIFFGFIKHSKINKITIKKAMKTKDYLKFKYKIFIINAKYKTNIKIIKSQ